MKKIIALIILIVETFFTIIWLFVFNNICIGILCLFVSYLFISKINNKLDKKYKLGKYKENV